MAKAATSIGPRQRQPLPDLHDFRRNSSSFSANPFILKSAAAARQTGSGHRGAATRWGRLGMDQIGTFLGTLLPDALAMLLRIADHWVAILPLVILWLGVAGLIGHGAGVDDLFRDDDHIVFVTNDRGRLDRSRWGQRKPFFSTMLASPAFWTSAGLALLGGIVWLRIHHSALEAGPALYGWATVQVLVVFTGWLCARTTLRRPRLDVAAPDAGNVGPELLRCILGGLLGSGMVGALYAAALALADLAPGWPAPEIPMPWLYALALLVVSLALVVPYLVAGLAVVALVIGLVAIVGLVEWMTDPHGEIAMMAVLALLIVSNGKLFKGRVPGLTYAPPSEDANPNRAGGLPSNPLKIPLRQPLERWLDRERAAGRQKPVLVLLATSGGAYRASFWTALVLDRLAVESGPGQRFEGLPGNIRLITGASGGMVAGAYFTALSHLHGTPPRNIADAIAQDTVRFQHGQGEGPTKGRKRRIPIPRDSLSPVVQQFIRRDLPGAFMPGRRTIDRGRMLDFQWLSLQHRFGDIATSEENARCPSIIFSPMLIETGSVVYASNLDLRPMRETRLQPGQGRDAVNDDSVELLDACPEARDGLTLATAVRLNATFPYVSPALSLPVVPNRRVVDSGYYDNYGGDVIAGWLATPQVRDWVCENCSGVAILQVRAFTRDDALEPRASRVTRALQGITSPPEGLFSARAASQVLRNNQQLKLVEQLYEARRGAAESASPFIRRFVFEAYADASMSWYLPDGELESLRRLLPFHPDFSVETAMPKIARDSGPGDTLANRRRAYLDQQAKLHGEFDALAAFWQDCRRAETEQKQGRAAS
jgi:hypothetical protein